MIYEFFTDRTKVILSQSLLLAVLAAPAVAQDDISAGKLAFNNACRTCHVLDKGDNRLGPNLHAILGREAGSEQNFNYSSALSSADFEWTDEKLNSFIADPDTVVPGNKMKPYAGMTDAGERRQIIAYLKAQSSGGGT